MLTIRPARSADFEAIWSIFYPIVRAGDSYVFLEETSISDAWAYWLGPGVRCFVAERSIEVDPGSGLPVSTTSEVVGMYRLVSNQRGRGSHVANASVMVAPQAQRAGIGSALGNHAIAEATTLGYRAMQFNFVVSTNHAAIALWQGLGFEIVGTLPLAFAHRELGLVDAHIMYRLLDQPQSESPAIVGAMDDTADSE
jgi:L-amino acid N-acyltransferase YncA